ncbi:ABC transporter permease [Clostridium sp. D2Q-14]|uniref:ABC transporter permease n=1 Tax=Anaeromonas gelatinilytica TaxID=2683194 RepID=UPI00193B8C6B|nr:ABC transporter permease [Anaeromonas gelatinilytica]MBS4536609.1 ABC transporter permease [Anaeromonas gelatinilytica]
MLNDIGFIIGTSLMYAAPLLFTALGGVISENSGVVNIGLEGMMTIGAFIGAAVGYYVGNPWIAFIAAGLAGGIFALLHAIASVTFHADQVVSGIAINFLGPGVALFISRLLFNGSTMTKSLSFSAKMPRPLNGLFRSNSFSDIIFNQYATVYLAFILVFVMWYTLYKTKLGLRIRAVGEHPASADTLGVSVTKIRYFGVILSGILAGFGGAAMSIAVVSNFRPTLISGQGFIALAAVIFGKWKPQGAMWACLLFGAAQGLTVYLGGAGVINISSQLLAMLPYVLTLVVLVGFVGKSVAPAASGEAYEKGE